LRPWKSARNRPREGGERVARADSHRCNRSTAATDYLTWPHKTSKSPSSVLASCVPRPGVGAGECRARPFFSGGVGPADAASEALALRPRTPGRGPLRSSRPLRCSSTAPRAPSRQRGRDHRGQERLRNEGSRPLFPNFFCIGGLAGRRRLPRRPCRLTFSATSSPTSRALCTSPEYPVRPGPRPSRTGSPSLSLCSSLTACGRSAASLLSRSPFGLRVDESPRDLDDDAAARRWRPFVLVVFALLGPAQGDGCGANGSGVNRRSCRGPGTRWVRRFAVQPRPSSPPLRRV
jgi:hypothetical protein